ncbi:MAG TPA: response regulator [Tepidisphaeraceae bacterium]|jgi:DNA-binding response OmpR family regulator
MAKILIVEDAQDQLELFAKTFRRAGFDVYGAHDGGHAMDRVRDVRPDVILLDQMMPEVDGTTFLQNLRRFPKYKNLPVILVTGITDKALKSKATNLGVSDVLVKGSFQLRELIDLVKRRVAGDQQRELAPIA